jgi:predicted O-methyltransferase YrrM
MSDGELARALLLGKPYFGPAMAAMQGPPVRHRILDALASMIGRRKKTGRVRILEVGSWAGASAITFGLALRSLGRKGDILCVDAWKPYLDITVEEAAHYVQMNEAAESGIIFRLFRHNLAACKVEDLVTWIAGDSLKVLPTLDASSFDLIYIDGSHLHRQVLSDITNAKRLIAEGGIIAGDDLELERNEVDPSAHQALLAANRDYAMDPRAMTSYHPGVAEAVYESFSSVSRFEGVWAVTKSRDGWGEVILPSIPSELPPHIAPFAERQANSGPPAVQLLDETALYNLVQVGSEFVAVAKELGPTALMEERIGERDLGTLVLRSANLEQLRNRVQNIEKQPCKPSPELLRQGPHYNVIRLGDQYAAVSTSLGPTCLLVETLGERELGDLVLLDADLNRLEHRIAAIANRIESGQHPVSEPLEQPTPGHE